MIIERADDLSVEVGLLAVAHSLAGGLIHIIRLQACLRISVSEHSLEVGVSDWHLENDTDLVIDDGRQLTFHRESELFDVGIVANWVPEILLQVLDFGAVAREFLDVCLVLIGPLLVVGRNVLRVRPVQLAVLPLWAEAVDTRNEFADVEPVAADQGDGLGKLVRLIPDDVHRDGLTLLFAVLADLLNEHNQNNDEAGELHEYPVDS